MSKVFKGVWAPKMDPRRGGRANETRPPCHAAAWAAQSRRTMSPGRGYSAESFNNRTSTGSNAGRWGGGSGVRSTRHKVIY
jgi:hypothetical protein